MIGENDQKCCSDGPVVPLHWLGIERWFIIERCGGGGGTIKHYPIQTFIYHWLVLVKLLILMNHKSLTDWHMSDPTSCLQMLQPNITSRMCWHLWSVLATADSSYRPALLAFSGRTWSSVVRAGEHFPARDSWTRPATPVKGVMVRVGLSGSWWLIILYGI